MKAKTLGAIGELLGYEAAWSALSRECARSVFQTPGWVLPWWEAWGGRRSRLHCVVVEDAGRLVGLAPLMLERRDGLKRLRFIGSDLNDYNAFLMAGGLADAVGRCIFAHLARAADEWDIFEACVVEDFRLAFGLEQELGELGIDLRRLEPEPSPLINLPADWARYCGDLPRKNLAAFLYLQRRLRASAACGFRVYTEPDAISHQVESFERARLDGWRSRRRLHELPPAIKTRRFSRFLDGAVAGLARAGGLHFAVLDMEGRPVASGMYFSAGRRLLKYMQAWDYAQARLSPGTVLDWLMIEYAIREGFSIFDFGRGAEEYKFRLGAEPHMFQNALLSPPAPGAHGVEPAGGQGEAAMTGDCL